MRPSLTDIQQGEQYLQGHMEASDAALYEARLLTDPAVKENTHFLQKTFALLKLYHRKQIKAEIAAVHDRMFSDPRHAGFQQNIRRLFKR